MNTYPLLDWHFVHYGIKGFREKGPVFFQDMPLGVKLAVQPAECSPPVFYPDRPWERGNLSHFRLAREGDLFRLWYGCGDHLCYAQSSDGNVWERPLLHQVAFEDSKANNICFTDRGAPWGWSWFEDKDASPAQRYKFIALVAWWEDKDGKELPEEMLETVREQRKKEGQSPPEFRIRSSMKGYVSPDRFHWTPLDTPSLMDLFSDSQPVVWYDSSTRLYRGYFRTVWAGRRAVGYAETSNFERWPLPRVVLHSSPQEEPDTDVYTSCYCPYPGRPDLHLMFPAMYHHRPDTTDIHLAVSLDGMDWSRPSLGPIIPLSQVDGISEQCLYTSPDLVTLPSGDWGLMYQCSLLPHNAYPHQFPLPPGRYGSCYRWARWKPHRLVGVAAETEGQFTFRRQVCSGRELRLNYKTETGGWVRVALSDRQGGYPPSEIPPLPNFTFVDCDVLTGDDMDRRVTWKGVGDLSAFAGRNIAVRFQLSGATIFALSL